MIDKAMDLLIKYRLKEVCPEIYKELNDDADKLIKEWKEGNKNGLQSHQKACKDGEESS